MQLIYTDFSATSCEKFMNMIIVSLYFAFIVSCVECVNSIWLLVIVMHPFQVHASLCPRCVFISDGPWSLCFHENLIYRAVNVLDDCQINQISVFIPKIRTPSDIKIPAPTSTSAQLANFPILSMMCRLDYISALMGCYIKFAEEFDEFVAPTKPISM